MIKNRLISLLYLLVFAGLGYAQSSKTNNSGQWVKVHDDDEMVTIYYNSNINTDKKGRHIVWVKAIYHSKEWQNYFATQIGSRVPIVTTKTKAMYDDRYCSVIVHQVQCYSKAGKLIYDSGDDRSAGWGFVNASDPVGIVGEYLSDQNKMY